MWNTQLIFYVEERNCISICNKNIHLHILLSDAIMLSTLNTCTYTFKLGKRANPSIYTSKGKFLYRCGIKDRRSKKEIFFYR